MSTNLGEPRLSLDGYRSQVLEKLRSVGDPASVCNLLAEVDLDLDAGGLSYRAQQTFWQALDTDLDVLIEEPSSAAGAIIGIAKTNVATYLDLVSS